MPFLPLNQQHQSTSVPNIANIKINSKHRSQLPHLYQSAACSKSKSLEFADDDDNYEAWWQTHQNTEWLYIYHTRLKRIAAECWPVSRTGGTLKINNLQDFSQPSPAMFKSKAKQQSLMPYIQCHSTIHRGMAITSWKWNCSVTNSAPTLCTFTDIFTGQWRKQVHSALCVFLNLNH